MKTYVLILSRTFPAYHPKAGQPTYFKEQLQNTLLDIAGVSACDCCKYETRNCDTCGHNAVNFRKKYTQSGQISGFGRNVLQRYKPDVLVFLFESGRGEHTQASRWRSQGLPPPTV